jgi:hypothetical protein
VQRRVHGSPLACARAAASHGADTGRPALLALASRLHTPCRRSAHRAAPCACARSRCCPAPRCWATRSHPRPGWQTPPVQASGRTCMCVCVWWRSAQGTAAKHHRLGASSASSHTCMAMMLPRMLWHLVEMSMILSVPSIRSLRGGQQQQGPRVLSATHAVFVRACRAAATCQRTCTSRPRAAAAAGSSPLCPGASASQSAHVCLCAQLVTREAAQTTRRGGWRGLAVHAHARVRAHAHAPAGSLPRSWPQTGPQHCVLQRWAAAGTAWAPASWRWLVAPARQQLGRAG